MHAGTVLAFNAACTDFKIEFPHRKSHYSADGHAQISIDDFIQFSVVNSTMNTDDTYNLSLCEVVLVYIGPCLLSFNQIQDGGNCFAADSCHIYAMLSNQHSAVPSRCQRTLAMFKICTKHIQLSRLRIDGAVSLQRCADPWTLIPNFIQTTLNRWLYSCINDI